MKMDTDTRDTIKSKFLLGSGSEDQVIPKQTLTEMSSSLTSIGTSFNRMSAYTSNILRIQAAMQKAAIMSMKKAKSPLEALQVMDSGNQSSIDEKLVEVFPQLTKVIDQVHKSLQKLDLTDQANAPDNAAKGSTTQAVPTQPVVEDPLPEVKVEEKNKAKIAVKKQNERTKATRRPAKPTSEIAKKSSEKTIKPQASTKGKTEAKVEKQLTQNATKAVDKGNAGASPAAKAQPTSDTGGSSWTSKLSDFIGDSVTNVQSSIADFLANIGKFVGDGRADAALAGTAVAGVGTAGLATGSLLSSETAGGEGFPGANGKVAEAGKGYTTIDYNSGRVEKRIGSRNWRNHNPGNLEYGSFAKKFNAIGTDGRFAVFPAYQDGRKAKEALLFQGKNYKDLTIGQAISRYAPPSENNTRNYINTVVKATGASSETSLQSLSSNQRGAMLGAMEKIEGFKAGTVQVIKAGNTSAAGGGQSVGGAPSQAASAGKQAPGAAGFNDNVKAVKGNIKQFANFGSGVNYEGLKDPVKRRFTAMAAEHYQKTGKKVQINSALRTRADQERLFKQYGPKRAAPPGRSLHESGVAIDVNTPDVQRLEKLGLLKKYGFWLPYFPKETWHLEPVEGSRVKGQSDNPYNPGAPIIQKEKGKAVVQDSTGKSKPITDPKKQVGPVATGMAIQKKVGDKTVIQNQPGPIIAPSGGNPLSYLAGMKPAKGIATHNVNTADDYKAYFNAA